MKKIISLALAVMMIATMSVTAFAADNTLDNERKTGTTEVTHAVSDSYIVTIPDSMTVGTDKTVEADNIVIGYGKQLTVSVSSQNSWKLINNDDSLKYTLKIGDTAASANNTVLTAVSGDTVSKTLSATVDDDQSAKYAGNYTDTLTFTVSVNDATSGS